MQTAITIDNLQKTFGRGKQSVVAVKKVNLSVESQQVFGFLGPNGAGKSTTIRMILNLIRPTRGEVKVYGESVQSAHEVLQKRVGALVDGAQFYPFLTGRQNLEVIARTGGIYSAKQIDDLLGALDMADRADRPLKGYSTGMRQRIGIAATLLGSPDLIILDEPTNGLDPKGIREIRQFIRDLVDKQGKTVFLSSHLLNEVEQVCDQVAIINQGEIIKQGTVADLLSGQVSIRIETDRIQAAQQALAHHWQSQADDNLNWLTVKANRDDTPRIVQGLVSAQIPVYQVLTQRPSLEDYFLEVTGAEVANHA